MMNKREKNELLIGGGAAGTVIGESCIYNLEWRSGRLPFSSFFFFGGGAAGSLALIHETSESNKKRIN